MLQDLNILSDARLEKLSKLLLTLKPGADIEEAKTAARRLHESTQIIYAVQLSGQFHGDVTLIKAESSTRLPGLTPDYSLNEVHEPYFLF